MRHLTLIMVVAAVLGAFAIGGLVYALAHRTDDAVESSADTQAIQRDWDIYDYAQSACDRGNNLRVELNSIVVAIQGVNQLLVEFFDSSAAFRTAEGRARLAKESIEARDAIKEYAESATLLPLIECDLVWPIPSEPRPLPE